MAWVSFASLSISKFVGSVGADVGFASIVGLAALALLYFAGARETRNVREQLEDAHDRITALESRIGQLMRGQAARPATPPAAAPAPTITPAPALRPMGTAVAQVRRQAEVDAQRAEAQPAGAALSGAGTGVGAPALGSATKLIPTPVAPERDFDPFDVPSGFPAPRPTVSVGASQTAAVAIGAGARSSTAIDVADEEYQPDDTMFVPAGASLGNGSGGRGPGRPGATLPPIPAPAGRNPAAPPRVQIRSEDEDGSPGGPPPRRTIPTVQGDGPSAPRRFAGRLLPLLIGVGVVAAIVVVLLVVTQSGKAPVPVRASTTVTHRHTAPKPVFDPAKVTVSVLNGSGLTGLAGSVGKILTHAGYTVPPAAITNADIETDATTTVEYRPGYSADAAHVAASLSTSTKVSVTGVSPATQQNIISCGTPAPGTGAPGTCPADVIVVVGTDLASVGTGTGTGA